MDISPSSKGVKKNVSKVKMQEKATYPHKMLIIVIWDKMNHIFTASIVTVCANWRKTIKMAIQGRLKLSMLSAVYFSVKVAPNVAGAVWLCKTTTTPSLIKW